MYEAHQCVAIRLFILTPILPHVDSSLGSTCASHKSEEMTGAVKWMTNILCVGLCVFAVKVDQADCAMQVWGDTGVWAIL